MIVDEFMLVIKNVKNLLEHTEAILMVEDLRKNAVVVAIEEE